MSPSPLEGLLNEDLQANACAFSTGPALRLFFGQRLEIHEVREGVRQGTITEQAILDFVARLLQAMRPGVLFPYDLPLGALAVACADLPSLFADTFLRELADMNLAEMPLGPRVAREVLARRTSARG